MRNRMLKRAIIYKISLADGSKVYVGSTSKTLNARINNHVFNYKSFLAGNYHYVTSFEIVKTQGFTYEILEKFTNISKDDLETKEGEYIKKLNTINMRAAGKAAAKENKRAYNNQKHHCCKCYGNYTTKNRKQHLRTQKHIKCLENEIRKLKELLLNELKKIQAAKIINNFNQCPITNLTINQ